MYSSYIHCAYKKPVRFTERAAVNLNARHTLTPSDLSHKCYFYI
jgi:hypothetical protein